MKKILYLCVTLNNVELSEEEQKLLQKIKEKKKELRKKERKEKQNKTEKNKTEVTSINSDIEDLESEDKSFDSLSSFTGDVTNKVGAVGDNVKSGVSVSFRSINFITCFKRM